MCVRPRRARVVATAMLVALLGSGLFAGCGAGQEPLPTVSPSISPSISPSPSATPSIPPDGVTLRMLGFTNGPVDTFSVPVGAVVTDRVDQPNAVTVVMSAPDTAEIAAYYRTALPAAGFSITADDPATNTLTFSGQGWTGVLTGSAAATAVSLRPR